MMEDVRSRLLSHARRCCDGMTAVERTAAALILILVVMRIASVPVGQPNFHPFTMADDTWEWICQALRYLGYDTPTLGRPPLFAYLAAGLYAVGAEDYLGLSLQIVALLGIAATAAVACMLLGRRIALLTALVALANGQFLMMSSYLNPDVMHASLLAFALALLVGGTARSIVASWCLLGLALLAHQNHTAVIAFAGCALVVQRRRILSRPNAIGLLLFAVLVSTHYLFGVDYLAGFSSRYAADLTVKTPSAASRFLWLTLCATTLTGAVLAVAGAARLTLDRMRRTAALAIACWFAPAFLFFTFFWATATGRWITYFMLPLSIVIACGLAPVLERIPRAAACLMLVLVAVMLNLSDTEGGYEPEKLVITPGMAVNADARIVTTDAYPALQFLLASDMDLVREELGRNVLPVEMAQIARFVRTTLKEPGDYFTMLFFNMRIRHRMTYKMQALVRRQSRMVTPETLRDPRNRIMVMVDVPHEEAVENRNGMPVLVSSGVRGSEETYRDAMRYVMATGTFMPSLCKVPIATFVRIRS